MTEQPEMNEGLEGADALLSAVEEFGRTASALGGFRAQLMNQGFNDEAADHLVVMMVGHSLQEASKREAAEALRQQEQDPRAMLRRLFGGGMP